MSSSLPTHLMEFRVRYAETDQMGYVHHSNYAVYFEAGRTEMLRARGMDYQAMEERGIFLVVAKLSCRFRAPARFDDWLTLETSLKRVTFVRIEHEYRLRRGTTLLCEGETTLACVDRTGELQALPPELGPQS